MSGGEQDHKQDHPGVIAPPPLIALASLIVGLLLDWLFPAYLIHVLFSLSSRLAIGAALFAIGAALAIAGERTFRRAGTNVMPWKPALRLATAGIYARVRNPMYVGLGFMVGGLAVALASDWTLVSLVPAALILHYGVVLREERYLESKFGDDYRRYKEAVPRYGWPL
jgi:protein-S-isoprenylcysteine O-methyltransferase Ste14